LKIPRVPDKQIGKSNFLDGEKEGFLMKKTHFDFERQDEEVIDQGTPKYSVMVYSAPKREVEKIKVFIFRYRRNAGGDYHCSLCHAKR